MRYLGNKTRLLPDIERCAQRLGFERGTVCDLFAGSAVVGRYFRGRGSRVVANDLMASSYLFQRLYLEWDRAPEFEPLRREIDLAVAPIPSEPDPDLPGDWSVVRSVFRHLECDVDPVEGVLTRQYSPAGPAGRQYFRPERAARLDGILAALRRWRADGWIDEPELAFLVAVLIDAADRRANISGTYGAFLKTWQTNTAGPIELRLPALAAGPKGRGHCGDARALIPEVDADLLYLDPPYNGRQYPSNYHLFEVIAHLAFDDDLDAFESTIYGKTGLIPWQHKSSKLCSQKGSECRDFMRDILTTTTIPRVVISYNEEGILSADDFEELLAEYADRPRQQLGEVREEISYRRFRSDQDGRQARTGASRQYKTVPGRERDEVREWLYFVAK